MKDDRNARSNEATSSLIPHPSSLSPAWRIFCAIELPEQIREQATEHIRILRGRFPHVSASWNRDGKLHLTLKFIGEIPQEQVDRVSLAAERASNNLDRFNLLVTGAGAFPEGGAAKVLWLGISDPSANLGVLQTRLEDECAQQGFIKERRSFHPHLTLARLRKPEGARVLAAAHQELGFPPLEFPVSDLLVIRSELSSEGSQYSVVSSHPLERMKAEG
jgi:RNA 2',3'-cyclic 3'-phosphodiesterase